MLLVESMVNCKLLLFLAFLLKRSYCKEAKVLFKSYVLVFKLNHTNVRLTCSSPNNSF